MFILTYYRISPKGNASNGRDGPVTEMNREKGVQVMFYVQEKESRVNYSHLKGCLTGLTDMTCHLLLMFSVQSRRETRPRKWRSRESQPSE